ncbi:MAG: respiratory nitrate reductase subunit gamma [Candidatus Korobacteraceae bacterium]
MTALVFLLMYAGVVLFVAGCIGRVLQFSRQPLHLRWELYPVPHEAPERVRHGGSYFEEAEWWKKERRPNLAGELSFMVPEMLFLKGLWEFNRKLWYRSFPFHFGLYLMIGAAALGVLGSVLGAPGAALLLLARLCGWIGLVLTVLGGAALFWRRLTDPELRNYSGVGDLVNVGAFAVACALVILGALTGAMPPLAAFARALLTFDTSLQLPGVAAAGLMLGALITAYVPYTHMGHFVAKYFTYHNVRWDDEPNNARISAKVAEYLSYHPTWSAAHVGADGTKTWVDVATANPTLTAPAAPAGSAKGAPAGSATTSPEVRK